MFRTSCVHHQEDSLYMQFLWYVFHAFIYYGLPDDVNMVFEACRRRKNRIEALIWKECILLVYTT